jgi:predicted HTH transcriptional regulator
MTNEKMTKRDFLSAVMNGEINDEIKAFAEEEIEKLDTANAKRREKTSKKREENKPLLDQIYNEILGEEPKTASEVAEVIQTSVQKASSLLRTLVEDGKAEAQEIKVPKKGKCKGYTKVENEE